MDVTLTVRLNVTRCRVVRKQDSGARQDNLDGTDQLGPGSHALNPHIHADAVAAGRVTSSQNEEG